MSLVPGLACSALRSTGEEEAWSLVSGDEPVSGLGCRAPRSLEEGEEAWSLVLGNEPGPGPGLQGTQVREEA